MKAVITTDLVQSSQMSNDERQWFNSKVLELIQGLSLNKYLKISDFETFRGDSFQCLLHHPNSALKTALIIKTAIRSWNVTKSDSSMLDVRVSLGIGEVEMETNKLGTSDGEAFRLSGRRLDQMKKEKRTFCVVTNDIYKEELATESYLLETILANTTAMQSEVIRYKIEGLNEVSIAKLLNISQSSVNQRANSGNWHAVNEMIKRFDQMYHGA